MQANDDNLRVYYYHGNKGEEIPRDVEKLIVDSTVEEFPWKVCRLCEQLREVIFREGVKVIGQQAFEFCSKLQKFNVPSTTETIGGFAFSFCDTLKEIDFAHPSKLREIGEVSFAWCAFLERFTPPMTVGLIDQGSFIACASLIEVDLFPTQVTEISTNAFHRCESLKSVRLPNLLERIMQGAFGNCFNLVTVEISSKANLALDIQQEAFVSCSSLCNFQIPPGSIADETTFTRCTLLHTCLGQDPSDIIQGLVHRFDEYPVHKLCYQSYSTTPDELGQCIGNQGEDQALIDQFNESPFHVLFSSVEPRRDLLEVLLSWYPGHVLGLKDENGNREMDHMVTNWTENTKTMLQISLQSWIFSRLDRWGISSWRDAMVLRVNELLGAEDKAERVSLSEALGIAMERYEARESMALLEMALWKQHMMAGRRESKRTGIDRDECRHLCGSGFVIPHVATFLEL